MKQVCLVCERSAVDRNLYCQDVHCPAELSPLILDYGELLGDIEIVKLLTVLPSSALYAARRHGEDVLLKVAHPGRAHTQRLEREARFLSAIPPQTRVPHLPRLLPPYIDASITTTPYGKIVLNGLLLYYVVFAHLPGEPLRDILRQTPHLWINHVVCIAADVAAAMTLFQSQGYLHLALSPESVLVQFDPRKPQPRVTLIDLGLCCELPDFGRFWYPEVVAPMYTAPELIAASPNVLKYRTDVYGLGLLLYEMLVGEPAVQVRLASRAEVLAVILQSRLVPMSRNDDVQPVAQIAEQSVYAPRFENAQAVAAKLQDYIKQSPGLSRRGAWLTWERGLVALVILLALAFTIAMLATFGGLALSPGYFVGWSNRYV